jgi:hypothetical protein
MYWAPTFSNGVPNGIWNQNNYKNKKNETQTAHFRSDFIQ